jgi:hypothetical protein
VQVRRALICCLAIAASLGPAAGAQAAVIGSSARTGSPSSGTGAQPSPAQIARAVARATRSPYLWATVNICLPNAHRGGLIGVRGEMPALGFSSTLSMTIQLGQYATAARRFVAVTGTTAHRTVTVGTLTSGIHQDGAEFPYSTDTGLLDATVTFTWTRDGQRLAQVSRATTGAHPSAAFGVPPGYSSAGCRL